MKSNMALFTAISVMVSLFTASGTVVEQRVDKLKISEVQAQEKEKNIGIDHEAVGYKIIRKVSENKESNTKIFYPQISEYPGELLMDYMNQNLRKIVDIYGKEEMYQNISIDYKITKMNNDILSVLFKGSGKISDGREINIQKSVNLDIKTSNKIEFHNLIKSDQTSKTAVMEILKEKSKEVGIKNEEELEGINVYFEGENVVFFYMPADDSATNFVEISVPIKEIESFINTDFGEIPAS
ncbi:hypothetical protein [Clostridium sp.]|uniref:hypothetical protein n=1 Tax=Clostridium sp. TaxID=1506 RepID=UPI002FCC8336